MLAYACHPRMYILSLALPSLYEANSKCFRMACIHNTQYQRHKDQDSKQSIVAVYLPFVDMMQLFVLSLLLLLLLLFKSFFDFVKFFIFCCCMQYIFNSEYNSE